jgi:hypothetical protein
MLYKCRNMCTVQLKFSHKKIRENIVIMHKAYVGGTALNCRFFDAVVL